MKKSILYLTAFLFLSCSNPLSLNYTEESLSEDIKKITEAKGDEVSGIITGVIAMYNIANAFSDESEIEDEESLEGQTYQEIYQKGLAFKEAAIMAEEEEKRLAEEEKVRMAALKEQISNSLTFALTRKGYSEGEYGINQYNTFRFTFKNKTDRKIEGVKGVVVFSDIFGDEITKLRLSYDDGINPNSTRNYNATTDYNQFKDGDVKLRNTDLEKLKVEWIPEMLIFSDGETISID